jgi:hypothetical protein
MVASVEVTMDRDEPTGAAVDFIEHAVGKGSGESACQFYGKVGNDYAHAFRVAAAARQITPFDGVIWSGNINIKS